MGEELHCFSVNVWRSPGLTAGDTILDKSELNCHVTSRPCMQLGKKSLQLHDEDV